MPSVQFKSRIFQIIADEHTYLVSIPLYSFVNGHLETEMSLLDGRQQLISLKGAGIQNS